ncbi:SRPBCC family protein [Ornithinibacillus sp. BX22]|uniref:SRPBCC family protein n=2 Tax=Ornithinibacillus TaxID=484508 RepID=A0A923RJ62_9BACI|nr:MULTISPECIES: SRPBCC family protein [Ornithinibacillus]MBC5637730.1 SRPBCC family protein [Ornithinibacillus hominis]MBS3681596.1 SRPBCC family protein [Ornithinibacillus massiliensis]
MPGGSFSKEVDVPIEVVWGFVSDMNKWAPLVPGYIEHKVLNEKQSTWKFKGDVGKLQKTVSMRIDIVEWKRPTTVSFTLTGLSENVTGRGYFEARTITDFQTEMTGNLNITAKGLMGPVINPILKTLVPKAVRRLTESIVVKIMDNQRQVARGY